jgi:hypothetical protein
LPEKIEVGRKLFRNHLTRRLSEYQVGLGKKIGSGTLANNNKNKANKDNWNFHRDWIQARDRDGIDWVILKRRMNMSLSMFLRLEIKNKYVMVNFRYLNSKNQLRICLPTKKQLTSCSI